MAQEPICARCNNYEEECICSSGFKEPPPSRYDKLKQEHPGYPEESYRAGDFLGLDFPYVPGDPGL